MTPTPHSRPTPLVREFGEASVRGELATTGATAATQSAIRPPVSLLMVGNFLSRWGINRSVCEDLAERLTAEGNTIITTSSRRGRIARMADMVTQTIRRRHDFDIAQVDVYSGPAFRWAEIVCFVLRRLGKPYVLTLHGGNLPNYARRHPTRVRRLLSTAHCVTSPSDYLKQQMEPFRDDIRLIPNAVDLSTYRYCHRDSVQPQLIWLRAFCQIYNPQMAIHVIAALVEEFPNLMLTMIGPDKGDGSLQRTQALARELQVTEHVRFVGGIAKNQVPSALNRADILLNTTDIDNTPVSVIEAMACGLCVVSTRIGGLPHLLTDGQEGLLVAPRDARAMAQAVRSLLLNPHVASRLSQGAYDRVASMDWSLVVPQWKSLLGNLKTAAVNPPVSTLRRGDELLRK